MPHGNQVPCPLTFVLRSVTSLHRLRVNHYYGFICTPHHFVYSLCPHLCKTTSYCKEDDTGLPGLSLLA